MRDPGCRASPGGREARLSQAGRRLSGLPAGCWILGSGALERSTPRVAVMAEDEAALTAAIIDRARRHGRYGCRRLTVLLRIEGRQVGHERVERIRRCRGLKVPLRQPERGRLGLNDGSCVRLRPGRARHVRAYDFVEDRTLDGRKVRLLNVVAESTRNCLSIRPARSVATGAVRSSRRVGDHGRPPGAGSRPSLPTCPRCGAGLVRAARGDEGPAPRRARRHLGPQPAAPCPLVAGQPVSRRMQRKPRWLVPLSTAWGWRAAGR